MAANDIQIVVGGTDNTAPVLDGIKAKLDELGKKVVTATANVKGDQAEYEVALINAKMAELSKKVASPRIDVAGAARAEASIKGLELQLSKVGDSSGDQAGQSFASRFLGYVLPGKKTSIVTGAGIALAGMPALAGVAGVAMGTELVAHMASTILAKNKDLQTAGKSLGTSVMATLQQAAAPLVPLITRVFGQIGSFVKQIEPELEGVFKGIAPIIEPALHSIEGIAQLLIKVMQAVVPAMAPFISGISSLVKGILPGFVSMIKGVAPVMGQFGSVLGGLGKSLGSVFSSFATVMKPSMAVLGDLLKALSGLLPVVATLAGSFAKALVPVLGSLGGIFKALEPTIAAVGKVLASFAGAVLESLSGALQAIGSVLKDIAPSFDDLAKVLAQVFKIMENSGVFGVLEDALENLAQPLGNFINALVKSLLPILPTLIKAITDLSNVLITLLSDGLTAVLNTVTKILTKFPDLLPVIIGIVAAVKAWTIAQGALDVVMEANPIGLVITAIGALVIAIVEVVKHWSTVEDVFKQVWGDILSFIKQWWPLLLGVVTGGIGLVVGVIIKYHAQILSAVKSAWNAVASFISKIVGDIKSALDHAWDSIASAAKSAWNGIKSFFTGWWNGEVSVYTSGVNKIKSVLSSAWSDITGTIKSAWGGIRSFLSNFLGNLTTEFSGAVNGIKNAWNKLEGIFKSPISFLVNTVYDNGIARLWNDVMSKVGGPQMPIVKFAAGGKLPGFGGGDTVPALLEPGEAVIDKHRTRQLAPLFAAVGVPGFSAGGLVSDAGDAAKMALAMATGNQVAFTNALMDIIPGGGGGATADLLGMVTSLPVVMMKKVVSGLWDKITGLGSGGGGGPSPQPGGGTPSANAALAKKMMPSWATGSNWTYWNDVAMRESGWSNTAQNASGALGIAQALGHGVAGGGGKYGNQYGGYGLSVAQDRDANNGVAGPQISWMVDYIKATYGSPQGAWNSELTRGWYAAGGATGSGMAMVGEYGRELVRLPGGASVIPHGQTEQMMSGSSAGPVITLEINTSGQPIDEALLQLIRKSIRVRGGNVQTVLGR